MPHRTDRIIFLDFDGVLITPANYRVASGEHALAEPSCVVALNHITDTTEACIVISSAWRLGGVMSCRENLTRWGVTGRVMSRTLWLEPIIPGAQRGEEIAAWIAEYPRDLSNFVILDDESDMGQLNHG